MVFMAKDYSEPFGAIDALMPRECASVALLAALSTSNLIYILYFIEYNSSNCTYLVRYKLEESL